MNKLYSLLIILLCTACTLSCTKDSTATPEFEVTLKAGSYKAGEAVTFNISGNPDIITFYSGETGRIYENRNRTELKGTPLLQFSTFAQNSGTQLNSLQILASSDFNGTASATAIKAASWTDITPKATLSTGTDNVSSGLIDLTGVVADNKPVYLAFRKHDDNSPTLKPRGWTIRSFSLTYLNAADNISYPVTDLSTATWTPVDILNPTYKWTVSSTALTIGGGNINTPENEDWVFTKVLYPNAIRTDLGIGVKGVDGRVDSYNYIFKSAGVYKVTFEGLNLTDGQRKSVTKEIQVTIN